MGGIYDQVGFGFTGTRQMQNGLSQLREDALRPGAAGHCYIRGLSGYGENWNTPAPHERSWSMFWSDMTDPDGGFYSARRCRREGEEGKILFLDERRTPRGSDKEEFKAFDPAL